MAEFVRALHVDGMRILVLRNPPSTAAIDGALAEAITWVYRALLLQRAGAYALSYDCLLTADEYAFYADDIGYTLRFSPEG